jgi:uncharacterized protein (TIGR02246 family)
LKRGQPQGHRLTLSGISGFLISLALALVLVLPAAANAETAISCAPISTAEVEHLFDRWNGALQSGDPDQVTALYSDQALLLPTLSPQPRQDHRGIHDYFVGFLAKGPVGQIESRTVQLGCNEAVDAGTYSFQFRDGQQVQARYTFVYGYSDGAWLIQHHHSSLEPVG